MKRPEIGEKELWNTYNLQKSLNLNNKDVKVIVLGTAQDGGFPQVGCKGTCCNEAWEDVTLKRKVSSLAIVHDNDCWLIDCRCII